jgi:hypothetical protein
VASASIPPRRTGVLRDLDRAWVRSQSRSAFREFESANPAASSSTDANTISACSTRLPGICERWLPHDTLDVFGDSQPSGAVGNPTGYWRTQCVPGTRIFRCNPFAVSPLTQSDNAEFFDQSITRHFAAPRASSITLSKEGQEEYSDKIQFLLEPDSLCKGRRSRPGQFPCSSSNLITSWRNLLTSSLSGASFIARIVRKSASPRARRASSGSAPILSA